MKLLTSLLSTILTSTLAFGQNAIEDVLRMQITPKLYTVQKTNLPIVIDGKDKDSAWDTIPFYSNFEDIEGATKNKPTYETQIKMLWDDQHLYIYAKLQEPHIWGDLTTHDAIIYHNNDFEIFLKPNENQSSYYEIEINSLNTVLDLLMTKPYRFAGQALLHWDLRGLQSAVHIEGTNNNPKDEDKFWAIELAIPFKSLQHFGQKSHPEHGDYWRLNFSRVQWQHDIEDGKYNRKKINNKRLPEDNWVWQAIGLVNIHYPEKWGYLLFVDNKEIIAELPKSTDIERFTWNLSYLQNIYKQKHKKYSNNIHALQQIHPFLNPEFEKYKCEIITNNKQTFYRIEIKDNDNNIITSIDNQGNYTIKYDK